MNMRMRVMLPALAVAVGLAMTGAAKAQEFKLRWGHYLAKGPFVEIEQQFAEKIKERTNGRVQIDMTFSGGLGTGSELLLLAGRGAVDMVSTPPGYNPDQLTFWRAFQIPFVFTTPEQAMKVLRTVVDEIPAYRQEMDKMGVIWLFQQPLGVYYLTGPSPECNSVAKLKGKKLRSFGADIPKAHEAIGAVPVTVVPTEVYESLQRGVIDYSFLNPGNIEQYKLWEVGKNSCGPIMAITGHNITISKRTWARLPKDIQDIFMDQAKKTQQDYIDWLNAFESRAAENIKKNGGQFIEFPKAELNKWKAEAPDLLKAWEEAAVAKGHKDAPAVAKRWRELTAD